jgi:hypothetical protein
MKDPASILGLVSDNGEKWNADNVEQFKTFFKPFAGVRGWLTFEPYQELHTSNQRAYWFGVVIRCFMEAMSETDSNYVHKEVLKMIGHCEEKTNKLTGEVTREALRTRRSSKAAYSERIEAAQRFGAEHEIFIPDPNTEEAQSMMAVWRRRRKEAEA